MVVLGITTDSKYEIEDLLYLKNFLSKLKSVKNCALINFKQIFEQVKNCIKSNAHCI